MFLLPNTYLPPTAHETNRDSYALTILYKNNNESGQLAWKHGSMEGKLTLKIFWKTIIYRTQYAIVKPRVWK
ncbi:hypothetical protein X975_22592, partial [Stegodyphus mimosarum]